MARRAELEYKLALSLFGTGDERRIEALERARDSLLEIGVRERAGVAEALIAEAWWLQSRHDRCMEHLARAEELIADSPPSPEKARVLTQISRFQMLGDRNEESIRTAAEALELIDRFSLDELRIHTLVTVGTARCNLGDFAGIADLERAVELAGGSPSAALWRAYNNLAVAMDFFHSDHVRALELHEQGRQIAERFGDVPQIRWFHGQIVYDKYWLGDFDGAMQLADSIIAEAEAGSPHSEEIGSRAIRARIRFARGDEDGAATDVVKAIERAREGQDPQSTRIALASAAFITLKLGRTKDAAAFADELLVRIPTGSAAHTALIPLTEALVELGRRDELIAALEPLTPSPLLRAVRTYARGHLDAAADLLSKISPQDEAYARLQAAAAHAKAGRRAEADAQLHRALAFWRSVGAKRYVREGEALLAATA